MKKIPVNTKQWNKIEKSSTNYLISCFVSNRDGWDFSVIIANKSQHIKEKKQAVTTTTQRVRLILLCSFMKVSLFFV